MKYISRLLLVTFLTFLLPCGSIFTVASELKTEYTFSDLQELKDGKWFSSEVKGTSAQYWPYNANNINAYLDNDTNLTAWNTKLTSDSTFQITGDTYISHQFTRPFDGVEQTKVDVKFSFGSRSDSERSALLELFGYNTENFGGSAAHRRTTTLSDSGLIVLNGGLYTVGVDEAATGKVYMSGYVLNDDNLSYTNLLKFYGNAPILPEGTLKNNTWYTIERLVDMSDALPDTAGQFKIHNQKIMITERESGTIVFESEWIPAGHSNTATTTLQSSLVAFTYGLKTGETVELDNYSIEKMSGFGPLSYTIDNEAPDYLASGVLHSVRPDSITFEAPGELKTVTSENVVLKKGKTLLDETYYTVESGVDNKSFTVTFNQDLEDMGIYTLSITGIEYVMYDLPVSASDYTFNVILFSVEGEGLKKNGSPVTSEAVLNNGDTLKYEAKLTNGRDEPMDFMVVVAIYNADNKLMDITGEWGSLANGSVEISTDPMTVTENGCRAEFFIFDNMKNMELKEY